MGDNQSLQSIRAEVREYKDTYAEFSRRKPDFQGTFRHVYKGRFHGDERMEGKECVVKVYQKPFSLDVDEYAWETDKHAYETANDMATKYNRTYPTTKPIQFVKPEFPIINTVDAAKILGYSPYGSGRDTPGSVTVAVERYLEGKYEKFINNFGYVHQTQMATPGAFAHFSYHVTDGEILVCDLQGVRTNTGYKLTDPAVHSSGAEANKYGLSDLGKLGIMMFFARHKCNVMCEGLKKPSGVRSCVTNKLVDFETIASKLDPEGPVMETFLFEKMPGFEVVWQEICKTGKTDCTVRSRQLGIKKLQLQQIQTNLEIKM